MYNKLFTKILDSSIWMETTPTRIVWLTFIAAMDEIGFAQFASVANLAHRAIVSMEEAEMAIKCLESPDQNSADPDYEGRRIERVQGGWIVLNSKKYRDLVTKAIIQEQTRKRVAAYRKRNAKVTEANETVTPSIAISIAESEILDMSSKLDVSAKEVLKKESKEILLFLNAKAKRSYRPVDANLKLIQDRLRSGISFQDLKCIVAKKCREWRDDPKMQLYLRPATLFNKTKCEQYLGELSKDGEENVKNVS